MIITKNYNNQKTAFSLIELSIVILIIGILVAGVTQGSRLIKAFKLSNARTLTNSSPVHSIKDLVFWLDATSEVTLLNQDGSADIDNEETISSWDDSNARNTGSTPCIQATTANQPQYINNAINGIPAVRFSPAVASTNLSCNLPSSTDVETTIFTVFQWNSSAAATASDFITLGSNGSNRQTFVSIVAGVLSFFNNNGAFIDNITITTPPLTAQQGLIAIRTNNPDTDVSTAFVNGAQITPSSTSGISGVFPTELTIGNSPGGTNQLNIDIAEVIIFDRDLKNEERESIESYLSQKWGITLE
jgi:prepilin-type N-terminal cleavage/methylation domain-containing protein